MKNEKIMIKNVSEIEGFEQFNNYVVMSDGKVFNTKHNRQIGTYNREYPQVSLSGKDKEGNKVTKTVEIHRLVALAFIPNPNNLPEVDHINSDKTNPLYNHVCNLRWADRKIQISNIDYSNMKNKSKKKVPVLVFNKNTQETFYFDNLAEACRQMQVSYSVGYAVMTGRKKYSKKGYKFIAL